MCSASPNVSGVSIDAPQATADEATAEALRWFRAHCAALEVEQRGLVEASKRQKAFIQRCNPGKARRKAAGRAFKKFRHQGEIK